MIGRPKRPLIYFSCGLEHFSHFFIKRSHLPLPPNASAHANLLKPEPEYTWRQGLSDMVEMIETIQDPKLRAQAENVAFHGYLSPKALVNEFGLAGMRTTAMRIFLHLAKTLRYPKLHAWFIKCCKVSHPRPFPNSRRSGESVYSWELMEKAVPEKPGKNITNMRRLRRGLHPKKDAEILCKPALSLPFPRSLPLINNPPSEDLLCP